MNRKFHIRAVWDDEAKVYYSESDIIGLHVEAKTLDEFEEIVEDLAVDMVLTNHIESSYPDEKPANTMTSVFVTVPQDRCVA